MILEVCWDGLWTLSFELSQIHGHGSWLVCEVAHKIRQLESPPIQPSPTTLHTAIPPFTIQYTPFVEGGAKGCS